jgi:hypothetical protein
MKDSVERYYNLSISDERFDHMVDYRFYLNSSTNSVESPVLYILYGSGTIEDYDSA